MERRAAIKNMGLSLGAFVATPAALSILQSCGPTMEPWQPVLLNDEQGKALRKIVDGILPAVDDLPTATTANVHVFIDKYWNEVSTLEDQALAISNLDSLMQGFLEEVEEDSFEGVSDEQIQDLLKRNLGMSEEEEEKMQSKIEDLYRAGTEKAEFPADVKTYAILRDIRGKAIWAYRKSEIVGRNVLAYDPVPATYIGCGDLQELSGGRRWSEG